MDDEVLIAAGQSYWSELEKGGASWPVPPPPEFPEPIEAVRERVAKAIGK